MTAYVWLAHVHPDMSKGHPRDNAWNVERDDHVKKNKNAFSLFAVEWCDERTKAIFNRRDKELIDLSDGGRRPDQGDVKIQTTLAEGCFVAYRFYN